MAESASAPKGILVNQSKPQLQRKMTISLANVVTTQLQLKRGSVGRSSSFRKHSISDDILADYLQQHRKRRQSVMYVRKSAKDMRLSYKLKDEERSLCDSDWSNDYGKDSGPSYGSILLQIHEVNMEAESCIDYLRKVTNLVCNTVGVTILLGALLFMPFTMVIVGVKYLTECPKQPNIPVYLLVGGCVGSIKLVQMFWRQHRTRRSDHSDPAAHEEDGEGVMIDQSSRFTDNVLSLFLIGWFIAGNYWVFSVFMPRFDPLLHEPTNWCSKTLYLYSLVQIGALYSVFILFGLIILMMACCAKIAYPGDD